MCMPMDPFDEDFFKHLLRRLREFDREFQEMEKRLRMDFREFGRGPGVSGFKVEIRDFGRGRPEVKVTRIGEQQRGMAARVSPVPTAGAAVQPEKPIRPIKKMLETNACKVEKPGEVVITVQAPGADEKGVEVRRVGEAVEIIARKPDGETYFCTFEIPRDARLEERKIELRKGVLTVMIPRRRVTKVRG